MNDARTWVLVLLLACSPRSREERPEPPLPSLPSNRADARAPDVTQATPTSAVQRADATEPAVAADLAAPYRGRHKLGVNRVTDMARTGTVTFASRDGSLTLEGRVARGQHWLSLRGTVEPRGERAFELVGVIEGVPDMAWAGEPLRERRTEGRFFFEVRKGRPYFRLYEVDGRECVCQEQCGNDFCYIDIEVAESSP